MKKSVVIVVFVLLSVVFPPQSQAALVTGFAQDFSQFSVVTPDRATVSGTAGIDQTRETGFNPSHGTIAGDIRFRTGPAASINFALSDIFDLDGSARPGEPSETIGVKNGPAGTLFSDIATGVIGFFAGGLTETGSYQFLISTGKLVEVPLPAALPMFAVALGVFGLVRLRRHRR